MTSLLTKTLTGYADRISTAPGETIAFKVSSDNLAPYEASIVRIVSGDTNPQGPGYRELPVTGLSWSRPGRRQVVRPGSCVFIPADTRFERLQSFALELWVWPTTPGKADQTLASLWDGRQQAGFILSLDGARGVVLQLGDGAGGSARVELGGLLTERRWYRIEASFDAAAGLATLRQTPLLDEPGGGRREARATTPLRDLGAPAAPIVFAARPAQPPAQPDGYEAFYNGKIEAPRLYSNGEVLGAWNFALGIDGSDVFDECGAGLHGHTWQMPARGMTGHDWNGQDYCWRGAAHGYGAIHFHDDDIQDARWATDFAWTLPADFKSGLYAAKLNSADDEDYIPFVVRPAPGAPQARLAFVVPTASYQAYANEHLAIDAALAELVHGHVPAFGPSDVYTSAHRELGGSLYDRHSDGSGIFYSSRLRPILNMRPKYQSWLGGTGSALWQLNADTHILAWLEALGEPFDCIADEDLDAEGAVLLEPYACIMTGTHPEYWSTRMLDALETYKADGGRIMYMGGNGLYWRIAYAPDGSGTVEVRRGEVGNGWITAPGEAHHSFSGEYGGLWRRIGRAPQAMLGVGFVGQGFDRSSYFRRTPESRDSRAAFVFDGVTDEIIGDFGLIGGGAAGIELDRTDPSLGTPTNTLVLARSEGHTNSYLVTVEELLINYVDQALVSPVYGELTFFETASGGAVFSTGSIAWAGSLAHNGFDNNVARITGNVLRRFLDPAPFGQPATAAVLETL